MNTKEFSIVVRFVSNDSPIIAMRLCGQGISELTLGERGIDFALAAASALNAGVCFQWPFTVNEAFLSVADVADFRRFLGLGRRVRV